MKHVYCLIIALLALMPGVAEAGSTDGQDGAAAAVSEAPPDLLHFSGNVSLVSDYRLRGTSYSLGEPAIQASVIGAHESGLYAGIFSSSLGNHPIYGTVEVDLFAGFAKPIAPNITAEVSLFYYLYPDGNLGASLTNSFDSLVQLTGDYGAFTPKLGVWYAWNQSALFGRDNLYLFADLGWRIPNTIFDARVHAGYTDGAYSIAADSTVFDWSAGVGVRPFPTLRLGLDYTGMGGPKVDDYTDDTVVASLSIDF